ncbi:MAG TPA: hypothetical protein VLB72_05255 [Burkholderiales bacterium]|nr:hypothetical protein [Burkholderiales bacterium]
MLEAYSRRTLDTLRAALPLRLALPHLGPVLARNVAKETQKDALVIRRAAATLAAGRPPDREALSGLLEATQDIDRAFLAQVATLPVTIVVPYHEVAPIRMQRIERLLAAAHRILDAWRTARGLRAALQESYARDELERLLGDLLRLYAVETQVLSRSVQLPALLVPLRERIAQSLFETMSDIARRLAGELSVAVFRKQPSYRAP